MSAAHMFKSKFYGFQTVRGTCNIHHFFACILNFFLPLLNSWTTPFCATAKASRENDETVTLSVEEAGLRSGDTLLITVINGVRKELRPNTILAKQRHA